MAGGLHPPHLLRRSAPPRSAALLMPVPAGLSLLQDIGLARLQQGTHLSDLPKACGTFAWMAPEVIMGLRCTTAVDIFSFGGEQGAAGTAGRVVRVCLVVVLVVCVEVCVICLGRGAVARGGVVGGVWGGPARNCE